MAQHLILLHGWGLNDAVWSSIRPQLDRKFKVHALNLPGFGGLPWSEEDQDIANVAGKLARYIVQHVPEQRAALLGWSMGGLVATELARMHPKRVSHLLCLASAPCFIAQPEDNWPGIEQALLSNFQTQLSDDFEATLKRFLAVQAMGSPSARHDIKSLQAKLLERPMPSPDALRVGLNWLAQSDYRQVSEDLPMPLYRAYGRLDSLVPAAQAKFLANQQVEIFSRSGHAPFLNEPDAFVTWVERALS